MDAGGIDHRGGTHVKVRSNASPHRTAGVWALSAAALAGGGALLVMLPRRAPEVPLSLPWPLLFVAFLLVHQFVVLLHVRGEGQSFTFNQVPLVVGLFTLAPTTLVAVRVGAELAQWGVVSRQPATKTVFNGAAAVLDTAVALMVLHLLRPVVGTGNADLAVGLLAALVASMVSSVAVWAAISAVAGRPDVSMLGEATLLGLPADGASAALGLGVVTFLAVRPEQVWVLLVPLAVMVVDYRRFLAERQHRQSLGLLYDLGRETHQVADLSAALPVVAHRLGDHVGARRVGLWVFESGEGLPAAQVVAVDGVPTKTRPGQEVPGLVATVLAEGRVIRSTDRRRRCVAMTVPVAVSRGRTVVLSIADPKSSNESFDGYALAALRATATHVAALFEDARLHATRNAFLSAVSHELRTPLTVVVGMAETLDRSGDRLAPATRGLLVSRLHDQAQRLDRLLGDLLDLDRMGRGMIEARRSETDVSLLLRRTLDDLAVTSHEVVLHVGGLHAEVDAAQLERIVENLVRNAVKYTPARSRIDVSAARHGSDLVLEVADHGPGIPDADKARVFEPFRTSGPRPPVPGDRRRAEPRPRVRRVARRQRPRGGRCGRWRALRRAVPGGRRRRRRRCRGRRRPSAASGRVRRAGSDGNRRLRSSQRRWRQLRRHVEQAVLAGCFHRPGHHDGGHR